MWMMLYAPRILADAAVALPDMRVEGHSTIPVSEQLGSTRTFDRVLLEDSGKADLSVALRGINGINLSQSNASSTTGLTMRGAGGGLGLVTLDGVPLFNSFSGFFPLSHYPLALLEQVSVAQGGGQRNGSRTLGGSINLASRDLPAGQGFLQTEGGSYGTLRNHIGGGFSNELGHWTLAGGRTDIFDGVSQAGPENGATERDGFQMSNALLRWNKAFNKGYVDSSMYFVRAREQLDGPGLLANRKVGWKDDLNGLAIQETWVAQTHAGYQVSEQWDSQLRLGFTQNQAAGQIGDVFGQRFPVDLTSQLWMAHWENNHSLKLDPHSDHKINLLWGVDAQQQHGDSPKNPAKVYAWTSTLVSPWARAEFAWGDWLANSELRLDHYDQFGDHVVVNVGGGWRFRPTMLLWAKGGNGYRAPSVNERLHPLFGSPNVSPEQSAGGEIGWRWQAGEQSEMSVAAYRQRYENLIVLQQDSQTGVNRTGNYPVAHVWGTELQLTHAWNEVWRSGLNYTFMQATNPQNGLQVAMRPEHQGQFWQEWRILEPLKLRLDVTFRDGYWTDPNNTTKIQAAPRLNAQLNYQANTHIRLYVRGENLNDDRTPDLQGFNFIGASVYGGVLLEL